MTRNGEASLRGKARVKIARERREPLIRAFHLGRSFSRAQRNLYLYVKACSKFGLALTLERAIRFSDILLINSKTK